MMTAPADRAPKTSGTIPWVEKYRPSTIDDIAQQDEVVGSIRNSLETGELPNMMFYGPPGTGKTSVALAMVQQFFGKEWRKSVKELNASDERGITAIREKVKVFAQLSVGANEHNAKARFRIIILDEADSMTHDAQAALRRIMEEFVHVTRFIIICNYVSKIIEPLHSRCSKFRFQCIGADFQRTRIAQICLAENVTLAPGAMDTLVTLSKGDLRFAVTMLQTAVCFYEEVDDKAFTEVACAVPDAEVVKMMKTAQEAKSTAEIVQCVRAFLREGYGGQQVLERLLDLMMESPEVSDINKAKCATLFSQVDERLTQGCDEELQLLYLFSSMRPLLQA